MRAPKAKTKGDDLLARLPGDLVERVVLQCPRGRLDVGRGLAGACRHTRAAAEATRRQWTGCVSCGGSLLPGHQRCELCGEAFCPACRGEGLCAESLHDEAETPPVCPSCREGGGLLGWDRCQRCFRRLCPVCHVGGLPGFHLCDGCYP